MRFSSLAALAALGAPLWGHHGTGVSYDASKPVSFKAVVTEFRYANPHPQLYFDVKNAKGEVVHWSGEFYPNVAQLQQLGWGRKRSEAALPVGSEVLITLAPSRAKVSAMPWPKPCPPPVTSATLFFSRM